MSDSTLSEYLSKHKIRRNVIEIIPGGELVDASGKTLVFKFRQLSEDELNSVYLQYVKSDKGISLKESIELSKAVFLKACIDPNFNLKEIQDNYQVLSAEELLGVFFCGSELKRIVKEYFDRIGESENQDHLFEKAKNY